MWIWITLGSFFAVWVVLHLKTSRPEGTLISKKSLHPYRTMLSYIMPGRNEAVVYFDTYVDAEKLLDYVESAGDRFHCDITHCCVGAAAIALHRVPEMNRFVSGFRLYQRNQSWLSFSMKRKKKNKKAKIAGVKMQVPLPGETFEQFCHRVNERINVERSDAVTHDDKELSFLVRLPRPILNFACRFIVWADYYNLVPGFFIKGDAFYTSMFIANLGSLGMGPGFHHLFEWGNCPLFMMVGKIEDKPVAVDGEVVIRKHLHIRWSYDERIDDGLTSNYGINAVKEVLEDPFRQLGCLDPKGADARVMNQPLDAA